MSDPKDLTDDHVRAKEARDHATRDILAGTSDKKVVVAGPGTGKTHLFKAIFATKPDGDKLTLTFINALIEDLALELRGLSDVKTLHGYALSRFSEGKVRIFPHLPKVVRDDGRILLDRDVDFEAKIHEVDNSDGSLDFYSKRRRYYDHFGYSDIILGLIRLFQQKPERIPKYSQVVVDEFQDFNQLEVTLIELLSRRSPIIVAGDDDQAIYDFKRARPQFIRDLHGPGRPEYQSFSLPFCSRSTRVIVDAVNDLVAAAVRNGFLDGRIAKRYEYFPNPEKDRESAAEPYIVHKRLEDDQIAWFIAEEMNTIATQHREKFDVLVISPYTSQCAKIGRALTGKGFTSVEYRSDEDAELNYIDGLRLLMRHRIGEKSNLGWRIACMFKLSDSDVADLVTQSNSGEPVPFRSLVPSQERAEIEEDVKVLKKICDKQHVDHKDIDRLYDRLDINSNDVRMDYLRGLVKTGSPNLPMYSGLRRLPITGTTIQSSKGLAADYVFITHFDRRYLPGREGINDQSICNMLVALTRARKKVWFLSTSDDSSPFLDWIEEGRIDCQ